MLHVFFFPMRALLFFSPFSPVPNPVLTGATPPPPSTSGVRSGNDCGRRGTTVQAGRQSPTQLGTCDPQTLGPTKIPLVTRRS